MNVDVLFTFAKVYNIDTIDVVKDQAFTLDTDYIGVAKWFADNDQVLQLEVKGDGADVKATGLGESVILIMDTSFAILKSIKIKVVEEIIHEASGLSPTSEPPVPK